MNPTDNREAMVEKYLWLVKQIASKLIRSIKNVEFDDLVGDGVFGLLKAIEQFDPQRGVKFETYATPVIRGSMLNGLRALDWVPERKRTKSRELHRAMEQFQAEHGRPGTETELAKELEISAREVYDIIAELGSAYLLSLEQPVTAGGEDSRTIMDTIEDKSLREPAEEYQFEEAQRSLKESIDKLPERENRLIKAYYLEGKSFEAIAQEMSVSKQRISQIHARAISKLRKALKTDDDSAIGALLEGSFMF